MSLGYARIAGQLSCTPWLGSCRRCNLLKVLGSFEIVNQVFTPLTVMGR